MHQLSTLDIALRTPQLPCLEQWGALNQQSSHPALDCLTCSTLQQAKDVLAPQELRGLGKGAHGVVVEAINRLDGRHYAIKKIAVDEQTPGSYARIMREVATLSRLQHPHVVRYFQVNLSISRGISFAALATASPSGPRDDALRGICPCRTKPLSCR